MHAVKIAALSAKGCCTATTMSLSSTKQKDLTRLAKWDLVSLIHCSKTDVKQQNICHVFLMQICQTSCIRIQRYHFQVSSTIPMIITVSKLGILSITNNCLKHCCTDQCQFSHLPLFLANKGVTALGVLPAVSLSENLRFIPPCCRFLLQAAVEIPGVTERLFVRVIDFILCFMRNGGISGFIPACPDENQNRAYGQLVRTTI